MGRFTRVQINKVDVKMLLSHSKNAASDGETKLQKVIDWQLEEIRKLKNDNTTFINNIEAYNKLQKSSEAA